MQNSATSVKMLLVLLQNENTLCPRLRNAKVEDLWSLVSFFGFATETFVLAVNILDRFLALMKVFGGKEMLYHSWQSFTLSRQINSLLALRYLSSLSLGS